MRTPVAASDPAPARVESVDGFLPAPMWTDDLVTALSALLIDPLLGGIILTGTPGAGKSAWLEAAVRRAEALEIHSVRLGPGTSEDRLLGGLDLKRTMYEQRPRYTDGLLAEAHGGLLTAHSLGRLPEPVLHAVGAALRHREMRVERGGDSRRLPTRFAMLGARLPGENVGPALADGVAFHVTLDPFRTGERDEGGRDTSKRRVNGHGEHPEHHRGDEQRTRLSEPGDVTRRLAERLPTAKTLQAARARLPRVRVRDEAIETVCRAAVAEGVTGHRGERLAVRAAAARAALRGRSEVNACDLGWARDHVLKPRRFPEHEVDRMAGRERAARGGRTGQKKRASAQSDDSSGRNPKDDAHTGPDHLRVASGSGDDGGGSAPNGLEGPIAAAGRGESERNGPLERMTTSTARPGGQALRLLNRLRALREGAVSDPPPPGVTPPALRTKRSTGKALTSLKKAYRRLRRGVYQGIGPGDPRNQPIALAATLRAAVPLQPVRQRSEVAHRRRDAEPDSAAPAPGGRWADARFLLRTDDLRVRRYTPRTGRLFVVAVDGSGSVGRSRLAQAKGMALHLVESACVHRDRVALCVFQGSEATLLVPPTRSYHTVARARIDEIATGGGTPLAAALELVHRLWQSERRRSEVELILMTDGRANVGQGGTGDGDPGGQAADWCDRMARAGLRSTVIDTAPSSPSRQPPAHEAEEWAERLGAVYLRMPNTSEREPAASVSGQSE